ncbi:MAG: tRNA (adenosine(37)-N6)-threonylcarbamoyltransferase complex ATPase subunit type 1 TsaE [Planctomycetota bacterium]
MLVIKQLDLTGLRQFADAVVRHGPRQLVIGLVGTLGAGKTTFTQCLAEAAGVDREDVTSPTFTLMSSYEAKVASGEIRLHHLDAYRLADEDEFLELGVEELFDAENTWVLIEWADRVASVMPRQTIWIELEMAGQDAPDRRTVTMRCDDPAVLSSLGRIGDDLVIPEDDLPST